MTIGVYSKGTSLLYTFEILKWRKKDTFKKWKFGQNFQRHYIRPKSMGLQQIASTLSIRAYILITELLVIKIFLRNIRVKKWCNELNFERSSSRVLNWNERYFSSWSSLTLLMSAPLHFVTTSIDDDQLTSFGFV